MPRIGGFDFLADPIQDTALQPIYWAPAASPAIIALSALPPSYLPPSSAALPAATSSRRATDGRHVLLGDPPQQIWLIEDPPAASPLGILLPLDDVLPQRVATVMALWRHIHGRRTPRDRDLTRSRRSRLILGLRALDGRANGASYRDLARGLFGTARVPTGPAWKSHDLRSLTMRLVANATALRDGGYRKLLLGGPRRKP